MKEPFVVYNSGNNQWFTPSEFIELARRVMGSIDLDPASCEAANRIVQAQEYFTVEDDGLLHEWFGNVWMNPPYSKDCIGKFADKLIAQLQNIRSAIVLVNNATETKWFQTLVTKAAAICFTYGRIKFNSPDGCKKSSPLQGQALLYYGDNADKFVASFKEKGWCAFIT